MKDAKVLRNPIIGNQCMSRPVVLSAPRSYVLASTSEVGSSVFGEFCERRAGRGYLILPRYRSKRLVNPSQW